MSKKTLVIEKLEDSELSGISGGDAYEPFNKVVNVGSTGVMVVSGATSACLLAAAFIGERTKKMSADTCKLLRGLSVSTAVLAGSSGGIAYISKNNMK